MLKSMLCILDIMRGCLTVTDPAMRPENGCGIDKTVQTIVCFCDTPRCNGLSISALAGMQLYHKGSSMTYGACTTDFIWWLLNCSSNVVPASRQRPEWPLGNEQGWHGTSRGSSTGLPMFGQSCELCRSFYWNWVRQCAVVGEHGLGSRRWVSAHAL